jgi:hypothetical protein
LLIASGAGLFAQTFAYTPINDAIDRMDWDDRWATLAAAMIFFFVPTVFLGMVSPFAAKLKIVSTHALGAGVGRLYALSSLGSIVGTLLTSFYLITFMGTRPAIRWEGALLVALGAMNLLPIKSAIKPKCTAKRARV